MEISSLKFFNLNRLSTVNSIFSILEKYRWKHFTCGGLLRTSCCSFSTYVDVKVIISDSLPVCVYNLLVHLLCSYLETSF